MIQRECTTWKYRKQGGDGWNFTKETSFSALQSTWSFRNHALLQIFDGEELGGRTLTNVVGFKEKLKPAQLQLEIWGKKKERADQGEWASQRKGLLSRLGFNRMSVPSRGIIHPNRPKENGGRHP